MPWKRNLQQQDGTKDTENRNASFKNMWQTTREMIPAKENFTQERKNPLHIAEWVHDNGKTNYH